MNGGNGWIEVDVGPTVSEQKGRRQHSLSTGSQTKSVSLLSIHTCDM